MTVLEKYNSTYILKCQNYNQKFNDAQQLLLSKLMHQLTYLLTDFKQKLLCTLNYQKIYDHDVQKAIYANFNPN